MSDPDPVMNILCSGAAEVPFGSMSESPHQAQARGWHLAADLGEEPRAGPQNTPPVPCRLQPSRSLVPNVRRQY